MKIALLYDDVSSRSSATADDVSILESLDAVDDAILALGYTPKEFMLAVYGKEGEPTSGARQMPMFIIFSQPVSRFHSSRALT